MDTPQKKEMSIGSGVGRPGWRGHAHRLISHLYLSLAVATALLVRSSAQNLAFGNKQLSEVKTTFSYTSHADLLDATHRIASGPCQKYAKVEVLGGSTAGAEIVALRLRKIPQDAASLPKVKIVGNLHGDEPTGRVLTLALAEWLCDNVGKDDRASTVLSKVDLWLVPTVNPDGYAIHRRENANSVDLNRDFPDRFAEGALSNWIPPRDDHQVETRLIMDFILREGPFVSSLAIHEGALVANYPWDGSPDRTTTYEASPDDNTFRDLARRYAAMHRKMSLPSNEEFAKTKGITNGAAWYPIYGSMQDWNYVVGGCMELTLEVSMSKWPEESLLPELFQDNLPAMLEFIKRSSVDAFSGIVYGIHGGGRKTGKQNLPIAASVVVHSSFMNTTTDAATGAFYRPLVSGSYTVEISAVGFKPKTMQVEMPDEGGLFLRVYLNKLPEKQLAMDPNDQLQSGVIIVVGVGMTVSGLWWIHLLLLSRSSGRSLMSSLRILRR